MGKSVTSLNILEANESCDITSKAGLNFLVLIGLNLNQTTHTLFCLRTRIVNHVSLGDGSTVNTEENKFAEIFVSPELEREGTELTIVSRLNLDDLFFALKIKPLSGRNLKWTRKIVNNGIENVLDPLVFES